MSADDDFWQKIIDQMNKQRHELIDELYVVSRQYDEERKANVELQATCAYLRSELAKAERKW